MNSVYTFVNCTTVVSLSIASFYVRGKIQKGMEVKCAYCCLSLNITESGDSYWLWLQGHNDIETLTCEAGSDVPTARAASIMTEKGFKGAYTVIIHAPNRRITHWPRQWWKPMELRIQAINCPKEAIRGHFESLILIVDELPLDMQFSADKLTLYIDHLPPMLRFKHGVSRECFLHYKTCAELPLWADRIHGEWSKPNPINRSLEDLDILYHLLIQSLTTPGPYQRWLTKGLYDPRLLIPIASFLVDLSKFKSCKDGR